MKSCKLNTIYPYSKYFFFLPIKKLYEKIIPAEEKHKKKNCLFCESIQHTENI